MPSDSAENSADLLAQMAGGDSKAALGAFYDRYASTVLALLTKMLGSDAEAEETLQDVFIEVWRRAGQYQPDKGSVAGWVFTIARSRGLDALRARKTRLGHLQVELITGDAHGTEGGRPDALASATRWHQALKHALGRLNEDQRAVLELSYFLGKSHAEIATLLNLPVGTVKSRILSGMKVLRNTLPQIHQRMLHE